jgi:hypothetical protein
MNNDIIQQGYFTSTGVNYTIKLLSDMDWLRIVNLTQSAAQNNGYGFEYFWQRGMGTTGIMYYHPAGDHTMAVNSIASAFTAINMGTQTLGGTIATTAGTNATRPITSTGSTAGLSDGAIVRLNSTAHTDLNGLDFTVDTVVSNTSFRLANTLATAPGAIAGAGTWRLVAHNIEEYKLIKPSARIISNITQATSAVVTTLVDHGLSVGQRVKFSVPHAVYGMTQIDGLNGIVTAVSAAGSWPQTFTVNIDTTGFTAFAFPTIANLVTYGAFTNAQVFPMGQGTTGTYNYTFEDAVTNQGFIGMILTAGTTGPAGNNADVIYWRAGKSFNQ